MKKPSLDRETVNRAIARALEPLEFVHALWEAGAASWNRIDPWSDIDVNIDAADDKADEVFRAVEKALTSLSRIELKVAIPFPPEHNYAQAFYRLKDASPFLIVDLAVFKHSATDKFLEPAVHGPAVFFFNKSNVKPTGPLDRDAFLARIKARVERLRLRHGMFACFVEKEIRRGHAIEAIDNYQRIILGTLLELLRIRYGPLHFDFATRYVHDELPAPVVRRFTRLSFVRDLEDLRRKNRAADRWLRSELTEIRRAGHRLRRTSFRVSSPPRVVRRTK
jgi:hypothetical protein